ncbi:H/ACA snoRNP pseudouridylase subunit [Coelomomyces lativittatus]|nr:H/ACA snoRNP pseudouridylase subunit [Coelomomyces lativittatus]KAJ1509402.1 H/ACA snoRNP pseudouridylase subunit [Coelomomyces lativittatus]
MSSNFRGGKSFQRGGGGGGGGGGFRGNRPMSRGGGGGSSGGRGGRGGGGGGGNGFRSNAAPFRKGRGDYPSRGGGGHGFHGSSSSTPTAPLIELGHVSHSSEQELVCKSSQSMIPFFNAPVYTSLQPQSSPIGSIDEILGPLNEVYFTIKLSPGVLASQFVGKEPVYIAQDKLLPMTRFLPKAKVTIKGTLSLLLSQDIP